MSDTPRLDELRRRVQKDPASIAFAQLAEEYRRAGQLHEAVDICRAGLAIHPEYLSARVTLGRALIEVGELEEARVEIARVLKSAPENLAAIRGLAEIFQRRGELDQALVQYRAALALARNDPDLEQTVDDLTRELTPTKAPQPVNGMSFEQAQHAFGIEPAALPASPSSTRPPAPPAPADGVVREHAARTLAALEQWLAAIHVARAHRRA